MARIGDWPEFGLERVLGCPVCASTTRYELYKDLEDRIFRCAPGQWQLFGCSGCGSAYLDPRPNKSSIGIAYEYYFTHDAPKATRFERANWAEKARIALENGYLNAKYYVDLKPSLSIGNHVLPWLPNRYQRVRRYTRDLPSGVAGRSVLDFGSGSGEFLELAQNLGWKCFGLDLDEKAVEAAKRRGVEVRFGGVKELEEVDELFDYLTISHVIEHVHSPLELLLACRRKLKSDGMLWLETPNICSLGHQKFRENWRGLEPPRHLVLFNRSSLERLLVEAGFGDIEFIRSDTSAFEVYASSEALASDEDPLAPSAECSQRALNLVSELQSTVEDQEFLTVRASVSNS